MMMMMMMHQQRLLQPAPTPGTGTGRRAKPGSRSNRSMDGSLSPIRPPAPDSPGGRRTLHTPANLELSAETGRSPGSKLAPPPGGRGKGKEKEPPAPKLLQGEGAKAPFKTPVLDGRRLPEGERMPKELEARERLNKAPAGGAAVQIPTPAFHGDGEEDDTTDADA
mmetsp:Transcript_33101/g.78909  ORF Transcript_33101/g.78909 Transcript_33101/m.78909 type:complete len:166 (+) Transcript_33101:23-520(+)